MKFTKSQIQQIKRLGLRTSVTKSAYLSILEMARENNLNIKAHYRAGIYGVTVWQQ